MANIPQKKYFAIFTSKFPALQSASSFSTKPAPSLIGCPVMPALTPVTSIKLQR